MSEVEIKYDEDYTIFQKGVKRIKKAYSDKVVFSESVRYEGNRYNMEGLDGILKSEFTKPESLYIDFIIKYLNNHEELTEIKLRYSYHSRRVVVYKRENEIITLYRGLYHPSFLIGVVNNLLINLRYHIRENEK